MGKKIAVTLTTINIPTVVSSLVQQRIGPLDSLEIVVVGDIKTPAGAVHYLESLITPNPQIVITYLGVDEQEEHFKKFSALWYHIPMNSFSRRNFGDLYCLISKHDYVIRIDDDNFPIDDSFIQNHLNALELTQIPVIESETGWYNICELLQEERDSYFFPRGYPYKFRELRKVHGNKIEKRQVTVALNAGLWLGDPDVDAITRLVMAPYAKSMKLPAEDSYVALEKATWSPINTQNTAYTNEYLRISFVSPFVGRYDDIFSGYILRSISDHMNKYVTYGHPLVNQKRNLHDLWNDEALERFGNTSGVNIIEFLKNYEFVASTSFLCYEEIVYALRVNFSQSYEEIRLMCDGMEAWIKALKEIYS